MTEEERLIKERARSKRKYEANKTYYKEKNARWFREHKEWDSERHKREYWKNPEKENQRYLRWAHRARIEHQDFAEIWKRLLGPCEICGVEKNGKRKRMHLDHSHKTGKFRGALCHGCNLGLGYFKENLASLKRAIEYLETR